MKLSSFVARAFPTAGYLQSAKSGREYMETLPQDGMLRPRQYGADTFAIVKPGEGGMATAGEHAAFRKSLFSALEDTLKTRLGVYWNEFKQRAEGLVSPDTDAPVTVEQVKNLSIAAREVAYLADSHDTYVTVLARLRNVKNRIVVLDRKMSAPKADEDNSVFTRLQTEKERLLEVKQLDHDYMFKVVAGAPDCYKKAIVDWRVSVCKEGMCDKPAVGKIWAGLGLARDILIKFAAALGCVDNRSANMSAAAKEKLL